MVCAIRNILLSLIVLASAASAQQPSKTETPEQKPTDPKTAPCSTATASASPAAKQAPDLSDAARKACKKSDACFWNGDKGCYCYLDLDGDGTNVLRIDTQSSAVQKNTADYEYEHLPIERSIGGILSLP